MAAKNRKYKPRKMYMDEDASKLIKSVEGKQYDYRLNNNDYKLNQGEIDLLFKHLKSQDNKDKKSIKIIINNKKYKLKFIYDKDKLDDKKLYIIAVPKIYDSLIERMKQRITDNMETLIKNIGLDDEKNPAPAPVPAPVMK